MSERQVQDLRENNPPFDLKCGFKTSICMVIGSASEPQLERISDLACDFMVKYVERCNGFDYGVVQG